MKTIQKTMPSFIFELCLTVSILFCILVASFWLAKVTQEVYFFTLSIGGNIEHTHLGPQFRVIFLMECICIHKTYTDSPLGTFLF